jgi:hypothetical protein
MSKKTNTIFPYEVSKKKGQKLPINLYVACRHLEKLTVVNMDDKTTSQILVPVIGEGAYANVIIENGRKILKHTEELNPKTGKLESVTKKVGEVYGYEALAMSLSDFGVEISAEEVQKLVEEKIASGNRHVTFCLKSDLLPCMPEKYAKMGLKNGWVLVSSLPDDDEYKRRINDALAKSGSRYRLPQYLDVRLVDRV